MHGLVAVWGRKAELIDAPRVCARQQRCGSAMASAIMEMTQQELLRRAGKWRSSRSSLTRLATPVFTAAAAAPGASERTVWRRPRVHHLSAACLEDTCVRGEDGGKLDESWLLPRFGPAQFPSLLSSVRADVEERESWLLSLRRPRARRKGLTRCLMCVRNLRGKAGYASRKRRVLLVRCTPSYALAPLYTIH